MNLDLMFNWKVEKPWHFNTILEGFNCQNTRSSSLSQQKQRQWDKSSCHLFVNKKCRTLFYNSWEPVTVSVTCLCWSLGHAEQLLFSCLCSKVSICNYVTCHISHVTCHILHVTCHISHVTCQMSYVICQMLMLILGTCWTSFVFMCKLKSEYL